MQGDRAALVQSLRAFCASHPGWALFDEPSATLFEPASGKALALPVQGLVAVEERANVVSGAPYMFVELGDGRQLALCEAGVAFPPAPPPLPQAPQLPPVVCLADYRVVLAQLRHQALDHPEAKMERAVVDLMAAALGILEGARRAGFEISQEERELEAVLSELEKRR